MREGEIIKGVYVLVIDVRRDLRLRVGALGFMYFKRGVYAYVGSAQRDLRGRLRRHLSGEKKIFWHIDYLLNSKDVEVIEVFYREAKKSEGCRIAKSLIKTESPISGFGCSGCNCQSHLFRIHNLDLLKFKMKRFKHQS
ncbi:MAG: GIY-YIG nuclease family protein [Myxococcota bacterium]